MMDRDDVECQALASVAEGDAPPLAAPATEPPPVAPPGPPVIGAVPDPSLKKITKTTKAIPGKRWPKGPLQGTQGKKRGRPRKDPTSTPPPRPVEREITEHDRLTAEAKARREAFDRIPPDLLDLLNKVGPEAPLPPDMAQTQQDLLGALPRAWRELLLNGSEKEIDAMLAKIDEATSTRKLESYRPFPKQLEYIAAGKDNRIRLLIAGNRSGKSDTACFEVACHLTGLYPPDWPGRKFDGPINCWLGGISAQSTRDILQEKLVGPPSRKAEWGTGFLPRHTIDLDTISMLTGVTSAIDTLNVRHVSGKYSTCSMKSFSQGRDKWQGTAVNLILLDEEAPLDIYSEASTRLATTEGSMMLTFTPLTGTTPLVQQFLNPKTCPGAVIHASIHDNHSMSKEAIAAVIASWPEHERAARESGIPFLGSGAIFTVPESEIRCDPFPIPEHYKVLCAIDLGFDHPAAFVKVAIDTEADVVYVTHIHRVRRQTPMEHAVTIREWGKNLPIVYPHDSLQHDKGSGITFATMYSNHGLNMVARACWEDGSMSVERGLQEMTERFMTGRLKIFSNLGEWFEEYRSYHRRSGTIYKENDDLLAATRYAIMGLRYAMPPQSNWQSWDTNVPLRRNIRGIV